MTILSHLRVPLILATLSLSLSACVDDPDDPDALDIDTIEAQLTRDELWSQIKTFEQSVPAPPASETIDLGTFDPRLSCDPRLGQSSACFTGGSKWKSELIGGRPYLSQIPRALSSRARALNLRFRLLGASSMTVTVNGVTQSGSIVTIPASLAYEQGINLRITSGTRVYTDVMTARRLDFGIGGFTVPVLPIAVVYEPPQPPSRTARNYAQYSTSTTVGTSIGWRRSTERSETTFAAPETTSNTINSIYSTYTSLGGAGYVGDALRGLASGVGSVSGMQTQSVRSYRERRVNLSATTFSEITTYAGTGPGDGDVLVYLRDARVMWVWDGGRLQLTVIDPGTQVVASAGAVRRDPSFYASTPRGVGLRALVALDPFATGGPNAYLNPARYTTKTPLEINGAAWRYGSSHTVTTTDLSGTTSTSIDIENHNAGWAAFLGLGEERTYSRRVSLDIGASRELSVSSTTTSLFALFATQFETYKVQVYYDRLFNTFALRFPPPPGCIGLTCN
jgi:hypothetical protein